MPAMALTDHGVMYGLIEFYQKASKAGIKPILGVEAYVARFGHAEKRPDNTRPYHLLLLAADEAGYRNLIKLTTIAHLDGFYYKPRIDMALLAKHREGLICLSGCLQSQLSQAILSTNEKEISRTLQTFTEIFSKDNFYLEVQHHPNIPEQSTVNQRIFQLADEHGVSVVATYDSHYLNAEDNHSHDALLCIQTKKTLADTDRMSMLTDDYSFRAPQQAERDWINHPEVIANTLAVAERCSVKLTFGKPRLPKFPLPNGITPEEQIKQFCQAGLEKRYGAGKITDAVTQRLDYELDVISKTGFASYFLIVADYINWAKENKIVVGPGRGSAAGSLVSYLLGITNIDPLKYNLIFERFLNPERISMPDIDSDFADTRRDEVIRYVSEKYGSDHVAQIITFGTMAARAVIRDVGRVMGLPYAYCDKVAKLIPMFTNLDEALSSVPELREVIADPNGRRLIETAKKLEGGVRHTSTHACGVVITPEEMDNFIPRQRSTQNENEIVTQYEMHAVEDLGLLKVDMLGLKNLTIMENTLEILKKARGIEIDLDNLPLADKKTFALLQRAETTGVFQLESSGMKRYLKQLAPTELEDIIVMVSLYRPGPMEFIPDYIAGKHGSRQVTYLDHRLKPILEKTYGIAVYQEQVMEIARKLAGFSYSQADVLRKAVGKKIKELLDEQEEKLVDGMVGQGIKPTVARKIWEFILPFARYGFNRSHAACYAMIAYQTGYLKANYPSEFMASLLTADHGNIDRIAIEVEECRQMELEVLPPDINESFSTFTVVYDTLEVKKDKTSNKIRFGLSAVKNLGENIIREIIRERKTNGHFVSLEDLLSRVKTKDLNKKSLEALIKAGALDKFGERNQLLYNIDRLLTFIKNINQEADSQQASLFGGLAAANVLPKLSLDSIEPATDKQKLKWEKEFLGLYVSAHPLQEFASQLSGETTPVATILSEFETLSDQALLVAGVISTTKRIITKKGETMMFARIEDTTGGIEVIVFPSVYQANPELWQDDHLIISHCRLSDRDGELKLICNSAHELTSETVAELLEQLRNFTPISGHGKRFYKNFSQPAPAGAHYELLVAGNAYIVVPPALDSVATQQLKNLFKDHPGKFKAHLLVKSAQGTTDVATDFMIAGSDELKEQVESLFGQGSFRVSHDV